MKYSIGDDVKIAPQVYWKGYNLSGKLGKIVDIKTYYEVEVPSLNIIVPLFKDEMEYFYNASLFDEYYEETY